MLNLTKMNFIFLILFINISVQNQTPEQEKSNRILESQILNELNFVRTQPQKYLREVVNPQKNSYKSGDRLVAYNGLVKDLKAKKPVKSLKSSLGIKLAAYYHSKWMATNRKFSHTGKDGSRFYQRIAKYGKASGGVAENIFAGNRNARTIVLVYLIDAGIASRGHRKNILNGRYGVVGNGVYGVYSTMDFAGSFVNKPNLPALPGSEKMKEKDVKKPESETPKKKEPTDKNPKKIKIGNENFNAPKIIVDKGDKNLLKNMKIVEESKKKIQDYSKRKNDYLKKFNDFHNKVKNYKNLNNHKDYNKIVKEYGDLVKKYNSEKSKYCPDLPPLWSLNMREDPNKPVTEFTCKRWYWNGRESGLIMGKALFLLGRIQYYRESFYTRRMNCFTTGLYLKKVDKKTNHYRSCYIKGFKEQIRLTIDGLRTNNYSFLKFNDPIKSEQDKVKELKKVVRTIKNSK